MFVRSQKSAAGGSIDRKRLLPASASADASDHRHFSPVRPSLPWDHLPQVRPIGPLDCYLLFVYIIDDCNDFSRALHKSTKYSAFFLSVKGYVFAAVISILAAIFYYNTRLVVFCGTSQLALPICKRRQKFYVVSYFVL